MTRRIDERTVHVSTPESQLEFSLARDATGSALFTQVCTFIGLREYWPFCLQYTSAKGKTKCLKLKKKVPSQSKFENNQYKFVFCVKYYPEEVSEELISEMTQRLFYLHIKSQIVQGKIYCTVENALELASYQALISRGRFDPEVHKGMYLDPRKYIPERILEQYNFTEEEWVDQIAKLHKELGDVSKPDAYMEYLKRAEDLDMYGVTYFPIKNKNETKLWLGINALGLNIYEWDNRLKAKLGFPWTEIKNIHYRGTKVTVKPIDVSAENLVFFCTNVSSAKEIMSLCQGNNELYVHRRQPDTIEVQQMKVQAREAKTARDQERQRLDAERRSRALAEERAARMEQALQEQEQAYEVTQSALLDFQRRVRELEAQLEDEKRSQLELVEMQRRLEEVNRKLEMKTAATEEEHARHVAEREKVLLEIQRQNEELRAQEEEKRLLKQQLEEVLSNHDAKTGKTNQGDEESGEAYLQPCVGLARPEDTRQVMTATDLSYARRLQDMKHELDKARNKEKILHEDVIYEENARKGIDKYRTLHAIRQGNTKLRVEQFESL